MLYFRFNKDNFVAPQQECIITKYTDEKTIFLPEKEICAIDFFQVEEFFFKKLNDELCLSEIGIGNALYDVIGIPMDAFSINDEAVGNLEGALKFVLSEYEKLPIEKLNDKSINDFGVTIEFCKRLSNKEINLKLESYIQENNLAYVTEEVLWKNMTNDQKVRKFSKNLAEIDSKDAELIIVDPYIFSSEQDEYCKMLASILNSSKASTIIIVTDGRHYKNTSFDKVSAKIRITMDVKYSADFHDRFWITNRKKGFCTGTSFNGVGKKFSLINMLIDDDVKDIIEELCKQSLIS